MTRPRAECGNCKADLTGRDVGQPCPVCGDTLRRNFVDLEAVTTMDAMVGLTVDYGKVRPWQEQWRAVLEAFARLEDAYRGAPGQQNGDSLKRLPTVFCQDCWHLKDWLQSDTAVPPTVAKLVERYATAVAQHSLNLAGDVANTHKHHGRNPGYRTARVGQMDSRQDHGLVRVTMRIDWEDPAGKTGSEDALDLARRSVEEWRAFFTTHRLDESG